MNVETVSYSLFYAHVTYLMQTEILQNEPNVIYICMIIKCTNLVIGKHTIDQPPTTLNMYFSSLVLG